MWYINEMEYYLAIKKNKGTSLVLQQLRIHLPGRGDQDGEHM